MIHEVKDEIFVNSTEEIPNVGENLLEIRQWCMPNMKKEKILDNTTDNAQRHTLDDTMRRFSVLCSYVYFDYIVSKIIFCENIFPSKIFVQMDQGVVAIFT